MSPKNREKALKEITDTLEKIACGDFTAKIDTTDIPAPFDVIANRINKLAKKIRSHTNEAENQAAALQESEERLKIIFELASDAYYLSDLKGKFLDGNKQAERLTGYKKEELIGKSFQKLKLLPPDQLPQAAQLLIKNAAGKSTGPDEFTITRKDRSQVEVEISTYPVKAKNKRLVLGIARDITARKEAEAALRTSKEFSEDLIETANSIIVTLDEFANITTFNAFAERTTGYKKSDVLGKNWYELFIPERDRATIPKVFRSVLAQMPEYSSFENPILTKTGIERLIFWQNTVLQDNKGKPQGVLSIGTDVTEQRYMEKVQTALYRISEAASSTMNLNDLFHSIHETIAEFMPAKNFYIATYNPEEGILNFPYFLDEEEENPGSQKLGRGLTEYVLHTGKSLLASPEVFAKLEKEGKVKSVGPPSVDWLGVPLKIKDQTIGVMTVQSYTEGIRYSERDRDIFTFMAEQVAMAIEHKRAGERMKVSLQEKELLLKEIHHRVKNNIQTISSLLNLQSSMAKDKKVAELFREAQSRIRSMGSIHEMLYRSQDLARVDFNAYISKLMAQIFSIYEVNQEQIKTSLEVTDVHLDIDRAIPCGLIISEIVSNSLKHAFPEGKGGEIIVKMSRDDQDRHALIIKDTGVGIPDGFDPAASPTLGIQIVADLVRQLKGNIDFRGVKGTEIVIEF